MQSHSERLAAFGAPPPAPKSAPACLEAPNPKRYAMQAILTRYLAPTNTKPARIKASAQAGSLTLAYDHALDTDSNHHAAAQALVDKLGWAGPYYGTLASGTLPNGNYCHVLVAP